MRRNFLVDQEITLLKDTDYLNTKVYAETLTKMIRNSPNNKPFTIGLFGDWGSGKSSIIRTAREILEQSDQSKIKFATFDAWKYSEDAFRRSFIVSISNQLNVTLNRREFNLYENLTQQINEFKIEISKRTWIFASLISALVIGVLVLFYLISPWFAQNALKLFALIVLFFATSTLVVTLRKILTKDLISKLLGYLQSVFLVKYDDEKPLMFSPEQFSNAFDYIVDQTVKDCDKLIIVIDNIDRCERQYATELLSTIKGFLESKEKVLFIIPVDESALKRHIKTTHKSEDKEADEFLRKFFNTTLRIKPYNGSEIYVFAKSINQKYNLNFSDYTIDLVSKEYASNPRRIIQIFNNLTTELECFSDEKFAEKYETAICKLLIIREEFPEYYYSLSKNPYLLNTTLESADRLWSQPLGNFLNKTKVITDNISLQDLNKILSNSIVFSSLPPTIENYIENLQIEEIELFISDDDAKFATVLDYLIRELEIYKDRGIIGVSFLNTLDLLMHLNNTKSLTVTINKRIEEITSPVLPAIFDKTSNLNKLVKYSWQLFQQNRNYMLDNIVTIINANLSLEVQPTKWIDASKDAIYIYENAIVLKKLRSAFFNYYQRDNNILSREFKKIQMNNLISEELIDYQITSMANLSEEDKFYSDLSFVLNSRPISLESERKIIVRINAIHSNFHNKSHSDITAILNGINGLIERFTHVEKDFSNIQSLADSVSGFRTTPNPNYGHLRQYDTNNNSYIDEIINFGDGVETVVHFFSAVLRLTNGKISNLASLQKIATNAIYRTLVNRNLRELYKKDVDLAGLSSLIYGDNSYSDDGLVLLEYILTSNQDDVYLVDDEQLKTKLDEILNFTVINDDRKKELNNFLAGLSNNLRIKPFLISQITAQTKENILKLESNLQKLAIDTVLQGDKIFDFSENLDFLKVLANNGSAQHIKKLTNLIISKLQHDVQVEDALSIIAELKKLAKSDSKRIIRELEFHSEKEDLKDKIKNIEAYINRITTEQ